VLGIRFIYEAINLFISVHNSGTNERRKRRSEEAKLGAWRRFVSSIDLGRSERMSRDTVRQGGI
jgi:hypothetical protein